MLRSVILAAARSPRVERLVETAPVSRDVVRRFVAGTATADALRATRELADDGLGVTLDHLGEDTLTADQAEHTRDEYVHLLARAARAELTPAAEVSVKLSALGQKFDEKLACDHARDDLRRRDRGRHHGHARHGGPHRPPTPPWRSLAQLRVDYPTTGAVLQAYLRRTEGDCRELAGAGSAGPAVQGRVRGAGDRWPTSPRWTSTSRTCAA